MNVAETLTARLIGTVFVERGLLPRARSASRSRSSARPDNSSARSSSSVSASRVTELASVVAEQWAEFGRSGPDTDPGSNESWRRLGDIFVERGFVTPEQLEHALARQRETGERVGEALVAQGSISKFELAGALAEQAAALDQAALQAATPQEEPATEATVVPIAARLEEPATVVELAPESAPDRRAAEPAPERPAAPVSVVANLPIAVVQPESQPSFGWVAFASTTTGYRLIHLTGAIPAVGTTVDIPDLGERIVLRLGRSPLWQDQRTCAFLEQLVRPEPALAG